MNFPQTFLASSRVFDFHPIWFPLFFAVYWCAIMKLISWLDGWNALARKYPVSMTPGGEEFRFASMGLGHGMFPANYGNCLFVHVDDTGVSISILFLFRAFHPPLQIPWNAISECREEKFWWMRCTAVYLGEPSTRLIFHRKLGASILEHWRQRHAAMRN